MEPKRLYRSRTDNVIGGICGGIANYFVVDPTIIRIIAVLLLFMTGFVPMVFFYFLLWFIVPVQPQVKADDRAEKAESGDV